MHATSRARPDAATKSHRGSSPAHDTRRRVEEHCGHLRLTRDDQVPAFELLVLGCGGGPIESNLSSFLVKPYAHKWTDGCTGLEGGSTIGAVAALVERNPYAFEGFGLQIGVDANELQLELEGTSPPPLGGDAPGAPGSAALGVGREGGGKAAARVWDLIRCFAITHAHLDHIAGLIISSAACRPPPKPVYGIKRTIANIERLMDGGVWPMLGGWDDSVTIGRAYHYKDVPLKKTAQLPLSPALSFHAFPLSHGLDPSAFHKGKKPPKQRTHASTGSGKSAAKVECYDSTAFFVREEESGREMLFFGDVEPDSISRRDFNLNIWKAAAPKIVAGQLSVIFLECSYPSSQPKEMLFGHFSPPFILEELVVLSDLVRQARIDAGWSKSDAEKSPLRDVIVVIQHIKDDIFSVPPSGSDTPPPVPPKEPPPAPTARPRRGPPPSRASTLDAPRFSATFGSAAPPPLVSQPDALGPLLSMGPPVPTAPTRRPSSTAFYSTSAPQFGFGFPIRSSPSSRIMSGDFSGFSLGSGVGLASYGADPRRRSMPGHFFGSGSGTSRGLSPARRGRAELAPEKDPLHLHSHTGGISPLTRLSVLEEARPITFDSLSTIDMARNARAEAETPSPSLHGTFAIPEETSSGGGTPGMATSAAEPSRDEVGHVDQETEEAEEDEMVDETVHERIERELNELEADAQTGVRFLIALQGMRLIF